MSEKKSIVIKVKYPVSESRVGGVISGPQVVTEWNKQRIVIALLGIAVLLIGLYLIFSGEDSVSSDSSVSTSSVSQVTVAENLESKPKMPEPHLQTVTVTEPTEVKPQSETRLTPKVNQSKPSVLSKDTVKNPSTKKTKAKQSNANVVRALITQQINNREPGAEISKSNVLNKNSNWVYYFTELKHMKGQVVYHEWFKDNKLVSRHKLNIDADNWRTSSRKLVSVSNNGQWTVKLLDENGGVLNEKNFKVNIN